MKTSLFDFSLPESLIADRPANPRDSARMLLVPPSVGGRLGGGRGTTRLLLPDAPRPASPLWGEGNYVRNLPQFLKPGDVMVFNDTRVIPARLLGKKGEAGIEVLLHKSLPSLFGRGWRVAPGEGDTDEALTPALSRREREMLWRCFAKPAKKLKPGDRIDFAEGFFATVEEKLPDGQVVLAFNVGGDALRQKLEAHGHMPLPPYIEKRRISSPRLRGELEGGDDQSLPPPTPPASGRGDYESYQTIYAKHEGSVAAPTAGLHFTEELLAALDKAGVRRTAVTLHVGGGTFLPVKAEDTKDHVMHSEWAEITLETAAAINEAKAKGGRVIAVGTTSLRTLESATDEAGRVQPIQRETDIFITPGYTFKAVDMLLTNFHLPKSTLFMLVCAFAGTEKMKAAYAHAIEQKYRFYSYGDGCLLYCHSRAGRNDKE